MANTTNAQYVALTTHGGGDWWVVYIGETGQSKAEVEELADRRICGENWNRAKTIEQDTEMTNLQVVSRSAARRAFPRAMHQYAEAMAYGEHWYD
jgi:hypothetical protein